MCGFSYHCCVSVPPVGRVGRELCFHSCLFLGKMSQSFSLCCTELQEISSCDFVEIFCVFFLSLGGTEQSSDSPLSSLYDCVYKLYGPSITQVRIVSRFLAQSQTRFQWVLDSTRVVPCPRIFGISWAGSQGADIARRVLNLRMVVLPAPLLHDQQQAQSEAVGMRVSTCKSEVIALCWEGGARMENTKCRS